MPDWDFSFDNTYINLPEGFYTRLDPEPVEAPEMLLLNDGLAAEMGLDFSGHSAQEQAALFAGNKLPVGAEPIAQAYAGHQFGHFTMLGDGRAIVWGEHITPDWRRLDIQFKGSGRTPYSRRGDGRAALGPMLREYIISEAMHALGIPTTRSLAVVSTGEDVVRETLLPGAVLTRVAASHIRVGTFEFAAAQRDQALVETLLDYTVRRHFPDLSDQDGKPLEFLKAVMEKQADLIVHWMRVGFIHGVMNTDNMALSGETIDYGPCAFMDSYDPGTVFSSIDHMGRYAYANQPAIAQWNIARLAEALLPLIDEDSERAVAKAEETLKTFPELYKNKWLAMMRKKLGLTKPYPEDEKLINELLEWMHKKGADYTNTFWQLGVAGVPDGQIYRHKDFQSWYRRWQELVQKNNEPPEAAAKVMQSSNPAVIPRNHKVEQALEAATAGDMGPCLQLLDALKTPYEDNGSLTAYQLPPAVSERVYQTFCGT